MDKEPTINARPALLSTTCRLTMLACGGFLLWMMISLILGLPLLLPPAQSVVHGSIYTVVGCMVMIVAAMFMQVAHAKARLLWILSILSITTASAYMYIPAGTDLKGIFLTNPSMSLFCLAVILLSVPFTEASNRFFKLGPELFRKTSSTSLMQVMLQRELLALPRRKRFYLKRTLYVLVAACIIGFNAATLSVQDTNTIGLKIFQVLSLVILVSMLIIPIYSAAVGVVREKEEQTLGLLMLSDIQAGQFMVGKMLNSIFSTMMIILSVLPLFILSVAFGGVSAAQIISAFGIISSTIFLGTCLGLFIASIVKTERTMGSLVLLSCLNLFLFLPLVIIWICIPNSIDYDFLLSTVSPMVAMFGVIDDQTMRSISNCVFNLVLGIPFLYAANRILPKTIFTKEPQTEEQRLHEAAEEDPELKERLKRPPIKGNVISWRDLNVNYGGLKSAWWRFAITCSILLVVTCGIMITARSNISEIFAGAPAVICVFSAGVFLLALVSYCSRSFNHEKKGRSLDILLTTTLTAREIVFGKLKAILVTLTPWGLTATIGLLGLWGYQFWGGLGELDILAFLTIEYLGTCYLFSGLAMLLSIRQQREVGFSTSVVVFIAYSFLVRVTLYQLDSYLLIFWVDLVVHLGLGTLFYRYTIKHFRTLGLRMI